MKRPITVTCVLLLLAAIVGIERFNVTNRNGPKVFTRTVEKDPVPSNRQQVQRADPDAAVTATHPSSHSKATMEVVPYVDETDAAGSGIQSGGSFQLSGNRIPAIYYIRGRTILGVSDPDKDAVARLRQSVQQVASGFKSPVIVIDLDGLVTSESPFLVYGSPRFDLTIPTQAAYRDLKDTDTRPSQEKKIEEVIAGDGGKASN